MKAEKTQQCPHHVRAMKNQSRLTDHLFARSQSQSSHLGSTSLSQVLSRAASRVPLAVSSHAPLVAQSPEPSSSEGSSPAPSPSSWPAFEEIVDVQSQSPVEVEDSGSDAKSGDTVSLNDQLDSPKDDEVTGSDGEEEDIDLLLDAVPGPELKVKDEIHGWEELRKQIKEDLLEAYKGNKTHT